MEYSAVTSKLFFLREISGAGKAVGEHTQACRRHRSSGLDQDDIMFFIVCVAPLKDKVLRHLTKNSSSNIFVEN